jgi:fructuronate reductase
MRSERIVHIGLGAFFRAHQAWYTEHASDADQWGIVAYTGRSPKLADELKAQDCKYTLITRGGTEDRFETISSVVRAEAGTNLEDFKKTVADPETSIITLTITEAGYQIDEAQSLGNSALGRLALALQHRLQNNGLPLALVSCDNMPNNAKVLKQALTVLGTKLGKDFISYLNILSFVSTSVDRITPATTQGELDLVQAAGVKDQSPVVTEEFSDWILEGNFPLGKPNWESAGAKFVSDIEAFENRKLWLLNGAHSLIALFGQLLGHNFVSTAIADQRVLDAVMNWWEEASRHLSSPELDVENYKQALLARFRNARMSDQLDRIAKESLTKLSVRIAPVAQTEIRNGNIPHGAAFVLASYIGYVLSGFEVYDAKKLELEKALEEQDTSSAILRLVAPELAQNQDFVLAVKHHAAGLIGVRNNNNFFGKRLPK